MKILHIAPSLGGGGIARILYDYCCREINSISFDFIVSSKEEGILEKPLKELGCKIYHVTQIKKGFFEYYKEINRILKVGNYDIVHNHCDFKSFFDLYFAKKNGVQVRIAHSHRANQSVSFQDKLEQFIFTPLTKLVSTDLYACGKDAAIWAWGSRNYYAGKVTIMKNAIDMKSFCYSIEMRNEVRKELCLKDSFVVGNVARFCYAKDHDFLVDVFFHIYNKLPNSILLLIGDGELQKNIFDKVKELGLENAVVFLGVRNDVSRLLNAMDVFVLPSRFEGLPVSLIETQTNGLPTYVSDTITNEIKISDDISFLSKSEGAERWANLIINSKNNRKNSNIIDDGYDINVAAKEQINRYYSLFKKSISSNDDE